MSFILSDRRGIWDEDNLCRGPTRERCSAEKSDSESQPRDFHYVRDSELTVDQRSFQKLYCGEERPPPECTWK